MTGFPSSCSGWDSDCEQDTSVQLNPQLSAVRCDLTSRGSTQAYVLEQAAHEQDQHPGPLEHRQFTANVACDNEGGSRQAHAERPCAPRAPRAPGAQAKRGRERDDQHDEVVRLVQTDSDPEHGEKLRVGRQTGRAHRACQRWKQARPQASTGDSRRGAMSGAVAMMRVSVGCRAHGKPFYMNQF